MGSYQVSYLVGVSDLRPKLFERVAISGAGPGYIVPKGQ